MNRWYPMYVYEMLARDSVRNNAYRKVIQKHVKNRTVLEVGIGPFALLANMCVKAGAEKVYAIEENERALKYVEKKLRREGIQTKIRLVRGFSTDVQLEAKCDVFLHEIIGSVGTAEGMALVAKDVKSRFLKSDPMYIPYGCSTLICPVGPLRVSARDRVIGSLGGGQFFTSERGTYQVFNFPRSNLIAEPQEFERVVFEEDIQLSEERDMKFVISRNVLFDGFVLFIRLFVDPETVVDSLLHKTNWSTPYIKLLSSPIELAQGDMIHVRSRRDVSTVSPKYEIDVRVCPMATGVGLRTRYEWSGN